MDECVAVAVAEAVAVAVTEAVAVADQSIHDQSIHDPSSHRETALKWRKMKNTFFKESSQKHVYTNRSATFDENPRWRGSVQDHFLQSGLAWEGIWECFFRKELGNWGPDLSKKVENASNFGPSHNFE